MSMPSAFIAYPSSPVDIGQTIQRAQADKRLLSHLSEIVRWPQEDTPGEFIRDGVLSAIHKHDIFIADITVPNFNVTYEMGYAIGRDRKICLLKHEAIDDTRYLQQRVGIYDTIRYSLYSDTLRLVDLLINSVASAKIIVPEPSPNYEQPIYIVLPETRTDFPQRIVSRLKKVARLQFTSFDPSEQSRMSAFDAIRGASQSLGIIPYLLPTSHKDYMAHNLRSAFVAGIGHALDKEVLIL